MTIISPTATSASGAPISIRIPLTLDVTLPPGATAQLRLDQPLTTESVDPDYRSRRGYDPAFLGSALPLPVPTGSEQASAPLAYHNFSVVMHRARKLALFTAVNIDGGKADHPRRDRDRWILDDTFHFTNCTPQHHDFNAGSTLWLGLEDYVLRNAVTADLKVSVLSGPVLDPDDPRYRGVALPLQYWKLVSILRTDGKLSATAYLLSQRALLDEFRTERTPGTLPESFSYGAYRTFQVPVRRIADLTRLDLATYIAADPLERLETTGLPRELVQLDHILL